jgi:protein dithiol oxidoreductase (disulfide-forming)
MSRVLAVLALATVSAAAIAAQPAAPASSSKIEVIQFFSYGCPHCYDFEPMVSKWAAQLPKDVVYQRVPISLGYPQWAALAKAYYALEATRHLEKLDAALYKAVHNGVALGDVDSIARWAGTQGVDANQIANAMKSFSVDTKTAQAEDLAAQHSIDSTPSLMVAGHVVRGARDLQGLLKTADEMIGQARAASVARK